MEELLDYHQRLFARYAAVVDDLDAEVRGVLHQDWRTPRRPEGWSLHQILAHLRDTEAQDFLPCLERILAEPNPKVDCFEAQGWMAKYYRPDEPVESILADYRRLRRKELDLLRELPTSDWSRTGRHPVWGERTLQWWVEHSLAHAEEHLEQFQRKA